MVIGLSGVARSGKDTFFNLLEGELEKQKCHRVAFADELKKDLRGLLLEEFNIDVLNIKNDEEKKLIRPLLVSYGTLAREIAPDHWIKKISKKVEKNYKDGLISVITDVRYPNEIDWVSSFDKSINIYIDRVGVGPANEEEAKNCPKLKLKSTHTITWETFGEDYLNKGLPQIRKFINEQIKNRFRIN
jgi:hypothetical protein